jgi:2-oxoglutarate ferredoxin oxidoreductase subunit alpha
LIVLGPAYVQELYNLTMQAFDLADLYRNPVMILGDGIVGQIAEPLEVTPYKPSACLPEKDFVLTGCAGRKPRVVKTLILNPADGLVEHNDHLQEKYRRIEQELSLCEEYETEDAEIIVAAYGISGRIAKGAVRRARQKGIKAGLIRPITLWPFPKAPFVRAAETAEKMLVVEMSCGQFIEDVKLATECAVPVEFYGKGGGWYPMDTDILAIIESMQTQRTAGGPARKA